MSVLLETKLSLPIWRRGKVRDVYDLGGELLVVATDRISAFDVVLPCGIPDKGKVLNQLSAFWFEKTTHIAPNHLVEAVDDLGVLRGYHIGDCPDYLTGRSMIVRKANPVPIECIVRGYLFGSAWGEYQATGATGNVHLSPEMKEGQELPQPLFTPTTKSETGHDRPLNDEDIEALGIRNLVRRLEEMSLLIYQYAQEYANTKGIIIADTKFEFGLANGELMLIDELLTPDSSRFWDASQYEVGHSQPCLDKQPVRDWLLASGWDRESPPPMLPQQVIEGTSKRYREAYSKLTGEVLQGDEHGDCQQE